MDKYILDSAGNPVPARDLDEWSRFFGSADRIIGRTTAAPDVEVSTVFLGINHRFGEGAPLLFETMAFGGPLDGEQERYCTREEAVAGHAAMVERAR